MLPGLARNLADALVIEKHRHAALSYKYGQPVAKHERLGMIDLEAMPAHEFNCERLERRSSLKSPQRSVKVIDGHASIIPPVRLSAI